MAWIKRNLIFVILLAIGVVLTGFCGYLFYGDLGANGEAKAEYDTQVTQFQSLRDKKPYPSDENIQKAKEEVQAAADFMGNSGNIFVGFPAPPKEDEQGFKAYLEDNLAALRNAAKAAEVAIPDGYAFTFSEQETTLNYPSENIGPWMQQLEEIKVISGILFKAKINMLENIRRVHVTDSDYGGGGDYVEARTMTNDAQIVTPYIIAFRGFSRDLAAVLQGFAQASNCFVVKTLNVAPSPDQPVYVPPPAPEPVQAPVAANPPQPPSEDLNGDIAARRNRMRGVAPAPPPLAATGPAPAAATAAVTVLSEHLLRVTISVAVVKFKGGGH